MGPEQLCIYDPKKKGNKHPTILNPEHSCEELTIPGVTPLPQTATFYFAEKKLFCSISHSLKGLVQTRPWLGINQSSTHTNDKSAQESSGCQLTWVQILP